MIRHGNVPPSSAAKMAGLAVLAALAAPLHAQPAGAPAPAATVPADGAPERKGMATTKASANEPVSLNFVNADVDSVVRAIAKVSGRNFVIDPRVKGTINIVSSKPVPPALTYDILLSALRVHGFAAVESNGVTLVVPEADAKLHYSGPGKGSAGRGDRLVTEVIVVEHESAAQLVPVLKPLVSPNNNIAAYPANNTLVITDYAENVRKIRQIVDAVDRVSPPEPVLIALKHASVIELAPLLTRLLGDVSPGAPQGSPLDAYRRMILVPDLRSNSLLVQAPGASRLARLRQLIDQLDVPAALGGNMHVVYLKNAEATKLAQTLRAILSADTSAPVAASASVTGGAGSAAAAASRAASADASSAGIVQADAATNSLIITAPEPTFNTLRAVIEKLDVRRAQVFIEALVAEVSADKATELGIQWNSFAGLGGGQTRLVGGTNLGARGVGTNILDVAQNPAAAGAGLNLGVARGQITVPGVGTVANLNALARALESDKRTNILSTPNLLTLDSEEAKIIVGQNVPFITGSYAQTSGTTTPTPFQTIERKDVGLMLKVKPQITEGGTVRMQVFQEVSSVEETTRNQNAGLTTNKRSIESTVVVDDGDFIVLGGLIQDSVVRNASKVPWLGDLPLIGWLFRFESQQRVKTNLMVFLRPVIVRGTTNSRQLTADRYDYLLGEQKVLSRQANTLFSNEGMPQLPERDPATGLPRSPLKPGNDEADGSDGEGERKGGEDEGKGGEAEGKGGEAEGKGGEIDPKGGEVEGKGGESVPATPAAPPALAPEAERPVADEPKAPAAERPLAVVPAPFEPTY